jgi:hypothetical protein
MKTRRSFFSLIARTVAAAVAAPVIVREALAAQLPVAPPDPFWIESARVSRCIDAEHQKAFIEMFFHNKPIPTHLIPPANEL